MAIVTRYFSTTSAGAADGTSWANRAELLPSGNWSTIITAFDFVSGSDSLKCLIEGGLSYACSQSLATGLFANLPSGPNHLFMIGCDSSGALLPVPDPRWTPDMPAWPDTTLPVIAATTNIITCALPNTIWYLVKITSTATQSAIATQGMFNWCVIENSLANSLSIATAAPGYGCVFKCTGSIYSTVCNVGTWAFQRCRIEGVTGASGARSGATYSGGNSIIGGCAIVGVGGNGLHASSTSTTQTTRISGMTIANVGGHGIRFGTPASHIVSGSIDGCLITGCGSYGIELQTVINMVVTNTRLRDNTSGNINGMRNFPVDMGLETTDSDDATEYVNATAGDYRIKYGAQIWGKGYGVSDQGGISPGDLTAKMG